MKNTIIFVILFSAGLLFANPIMPGPEIVELYRDGDDWQLTLFNLEMNEYTLDNCGLAFLNFFSEFNDGIEFYDYVTISNQDLVTPLTINWNGQTITTYFDQGNGFMQVDEWSYGTNYSWQNSVNPLSSGQSLITIYPYLDWLMYVKDSNLEGGLRTKGYLEGYVYDVYGNPIENATLKYYRTNSSLSNFFIPVSTTDSGFFSSETYAKNYEVSVLINNEVLIDTFLTVEPDTTAFVEFHTDYDPVNSDDLEISFPTSYYNLSNYPNPFNPSTEISFETTNFHELSQIEIFNSKGQKVAILDCINSFDAKARDSLSHLSITWDGTNNAGKTCPSGVYFYKLVSGGKELAANKMLLLK